MQFITKAMLSFEHSTREIQNLIYRHSHAGVERAILLEGNPAMREVLKATYHLATTTWTPLPPRATFGKVLDFMQARARLRPTAAA